MTDFIAAVKSGNVNACSEILERDGSGVLNARDAQGFTALHHAALAGSVASVDWLVRNANADLHARNAKGETALHLAVLRGVLSCVQSLIRAGADTCACDHAGYSILHHSVMARQIAISNELLEANPGLAKIQDNTGRSSLHWAAYGGLKDVVDRLVTAGADPNLTDNDGCTPLHLAASFGHNMVIKALVEKGASTKFVEMKEGKTAIDTAASKGHHSLARYLTYITNRKLPLKKRTKFGIKSIPSLLGLFITLVVPPIISICSYFWLIPVSILGTIFAMSMKKYVSRTHQMEHFAYTLFFGTNALLTFTFLFGVATNELPIWTTVFALGAGVVWHLFFTLIGSDAGVVEQTESESNTITRAIETASFPEDHCVTCGVKRLPRMKHCAVCGKCVSKFDHHCVFLLGCVGEKNHKRFWLLLVIILTCAVSFVRLCWHFLMKEDEIDETVLLNTNWVGFCFLWVFSNSFWIFSLCFLQTRLIANNLTFNEHVNAGRYEYLQDSRGLFLNPYDKGGIDNFLLFLGLPTKLSRSTLTSASKREDSASFV